MSGQPGFKLTPAALIKVTSEWRAFLIARTLPADDPDCLWWARVRVAGGWLIELAGDGEAEVLDRLLPPGDRVEGLELDSGEVVDQPLERFLAGRAPGTAADDGAIVCVCLGIGERRICGAIRGGGLTSVDAIGAATGAGTNCGSCRPALARLLATKEMVDAA